LFPLTTLRVGPPPVEPELLELLEELELLDELELLELLDDELELLDDELELLVLATGQMQ
jgi:hypothetical protein